MVWGPLCRYSVTLSQLVLYSLGSPMSESVTLSRSSGSYYVISPIIAAANPGFSPGSEGCGVGISVSERKRAFGGKQI